MRRRRPLKRVVMHLANDTTVEGLLKGNHAGSYQLLFPKLVSGEDETHEIACDWLEVPERNVIAYEVHGGKA